MVAPRTCATVASCRSLPYAPRVLRTADYKLWIDAEGNPERLHHLPSDPGEEANLIHTPEGKAEVALDLLTRAAREFPELDGHPRYDSVAPPAVGQAGPQGSQSSR